VDASGANVTITSSFSTATETSSTDFNAGTYSGTKLTGSGDSASVELNTTFSDPFTQNLGSWRNPPIMPGGFGAGGFMVYPGSGNYIYALKGNYTKMFLRYDLATYNWSSLADVPVSTDQGAGLAYYNNDIYCAVGGFRKDFYRYNLTTIPGRI